MRSGQSDGIDSAEEISALVSTLIDAEERLQALTHGEVDSVSDSTGRIYLFRHAQDQLRSSEVGKLMGVLNALPAHIALVDVDGAVISVNEAWKQFAAQNMLDVDAAGVGLNYLEVCDNVVGEDSVVAHAVSAGIRSVLASQQENFSLEYECDSPTEKRWIMLNVSPLAGTRRKHAVVMHLDVTERKRSEEEFRALSRASQRRERLLHSALASMSDFAQVYDRECRILFVNQPLLDLWGLTLDEAVGRNFHELGYPTELADRLQLQLRQVFDTKQDITDETPFRSLNGKLGYYEYIFSPILALDGSVDFVVGSTRDISERRRGSDELKASEASMALAQRVANFGSWELDQLDCGTPGNASESPTRRWSHQMFRIYGLEPGEVEPSWDLFFSLIPQEDHVCIREAIESANLSGGPFSFIHKIILPSGEVRILQEIGQVLAAGVGERHAVVVGVAHDITERIRSEEALLESEKRFRSMLQNVELAAKIIDLNGNVTFCNDYLLRLIQLQAEEVIGSNWIGKFIPEGRLEEAKDAFELMLTNGASIQKESEILTKSGSICKILWNAAVVRDESGKISGVASIGANITERKSLEEQLLQSQKMEGIGSLAGAIAHDFNNLLTGMLGYSELAQLRLPKDSPVQEDLREIRTSAERGANLIKQLLSFVRKEEGDPQVVDPGKLIDDLTNLLKRLLGASISLHIELGEEGGRIRLDPSQFEQLIVNLVVNARDAMIRGGSLTIATSNEIFDSAQVIHGVVHKPGAYVLISVTDTGHGITKAIQDRIFDPFFTTKERGMGTGLGLSTCHVIVTNGGGHISLISEVNVGTKFLIYFPRVDDPIAHHPAQEESLPAMNGETVLVVDDQGTVRSLSAEILTMMGYRVLCAEDGAAALKLAAEPGQTIDLLLSDIEMPGMTGIELADALAHIMPELKTLFMSGFTSDPVLQELAEDQKAFLQKPFTSAQLSRKVWEVLNV